MKVCFFGHSDAPWRIQPKLREVILDLIDNEGADEFFLTELKISLRDLPSTIETNSWSKRLTSSSPTSDIRGEEQPSTSYWQKRKTGESSSFPHKNTTHMLEFQLSYPLFNVHNLFIF